MSILDDLLDHERRLGKLETQEIGWQLGGAFTQLESQLMTVATQTITFTSIDQTFTHLLFTVLARSDGAAVHQSLTLQFNNDTASNYEWTTRSTDISSGTHPWLVSESVSDTRLRPGIFAGGNDAGAVGRGIILLLNYKDTTYHKHAQGWGTIAQESGTDPRFVNDIGGGVWHNTAAVTEVDFQIIPTASHSFDTDSHIIMYGIA